MSETNINAIDDNSVVLPKLTTQQNLFVRYYEIENMSGTEAYRMAYNTTASTRTCCIEASRLLKNPNITLWLDFIRKTKQEHIQSEIKYSIDDAFKEFDDLKMIALESTDQYGRPNISAANKAVELKCKLKGLMSDEAAVNNSVVVQMGDVEVNGEALEFNIGESVADTSEEKIDICLQTSCNVKSTEENPAGSIQSE